MTAPYLGGGEPSPVRGLTGGGGAFFGPSLKRCVVVVSDGMGLAVNCRVAYS